jgi:hypothetical protein
MMNALLTMLLIGSMPSAILAETLEQQWNLIDPSVSFDANTFTLSYAGVSNTVRFAGETDTPQAGYRLLDYGTCQNDVNAAQIRGEDTFTDADIVKTVSAATSTLSSTSTLSFTIKINPNVIADNDDVYIEPVDVETGLLKSKIKFCVRFELKNGNQVVNFLETIVDLTVTLQDDSLSVTDINVKPKDVATVEETAAYLVDAFQCASASNIELNPSVAYVQGDVIRICVTPNADARVDGVKMRAIVSFEFEKTENGVKQEAIKASVAQVLTELSCPPAALICVIQTILNADFFTSTDTVTGRGSATMQFETGITRRNRALQADDVAGLAEISMDFEVVAAADGSASGAATSATFGLLAMTLLALGGAIAFV